MRGLQRRLAGWLAVAGIVFFQPALAQDRLAILTFEPGGPVLSGDVQKLAAGSVFRDCDECPELVVVPPGEASSARRHLTLKRALAIGRFEVTFEQWDACVASGGCSHRPWDGMWGRGTRPVIDISWTDAKQYTAWLSARTGKRYRLLTDAEWEYAARAGASTPYYWGDSTASICAYANVDLGTQGCEPSRTAPVGRRQPNAFGLYDMLGNVWEWTEDCWDAIRGPCGLRVVRGGSWNVDPSLARADTRYAHFTNMRNDVSGFRVMRVD
jgi:formylglycine-generating enzyme required for sulfatase activity